MAANRSVNQIISSLKTSASTGASVSTTQVKGVLDKQLQEAGEMLKAVILGFIQDGRKNNVTSSQSDIAKATKITLDTNGLAINLPDFADDIDKGRKAGTYPPFKAILAWALKYRIQALGGSSKSRIGANQLAFAIRQSIYRNGIKPRPFLDDVDKYATDLIGKIIDDVIFPAIITPLETTFKDK
jgi:hypothetical protein